MVGLLLLSTVPGSGARRRGRRGRLLLAYRALNVAVLLLRDESPTAGRGQDASAEARSALETCRCRSCGTPGVPSGSRGVVSIEPLLAEETFIDVEAVFEGVYGAESFIAEGRWASAWGPAGIAYHVATRPFLAGHQAPWIDDWRRRLEEVRLRGLECLAAASLGLSGPALAQAEERARILTTLAPYRETGHLILIEALERRGNIAEALRAYERLRMLLREELGIAPSPALQAMHRRLLGRADS